MANEDLITGEIKEIQERSIWPKAINEHKVRILLVERFDEEGNVHLITVELSTNWGRDFAGHVSKGDRVAFYVKAQKSSGVVVTDAVRNLTNHTIFGDERLVDRGKVIVPPA